MRRFLLIEILILLSITCKPQINSCFPDSFAIWSEVYYPPTLSGEKPQYYCYGLLNKDTVINSVRYHKLYKSNDTIFDENEYCGGIRQDSSKKVYYFGNLVPIFKDIEVILFNFN